jgi:hypothetical protein
VNGGKFLPLRKICFDHPKSTVLCDQSRSCAGPSAFAKSNNVYFLGVEPQSSGYFFPLRLKITEKIAQKPLTKILNLFILLLRGFEEREHENHPRMKVPRRGEETMESWRKVWREGVAPLLSTPGLEALQNALANDDARLLQGATTTPPPLQCVQDWPVEAACALGFCGWQGEGLETVAEVEEFFARTCFEIDQRLGEPAACRWFLNWFDETPRDEMRDQLLAEVQRALAQRRSAEDGTAAETDSETAAA